MGKMSDTPETDKAERMAYSQEYMVPTEFARRLERERDEARHEIEGWKNKWNIAVEMAARAENERDEARKEIKELIYIGERAIALAELDFENDKFGVVSELGFDLEKIKESAK
jgi:hypothetical protein